MEDVLELDAGYEMLDYEYQSDNNDDDSAKNESSTAALQDREPVNTAAKSADDLPAASKSGTKKIKVSRWEMKAGVKPNSSGTNPGKTDSRNAPVKTGSQNAPAKSGSTTAPEKFGSTRKPEKKLVWPTITRKNTCKIIFLES